MLQNPQSEVHVSRRPDIVALPYVGKQWQKIETPEIDPRIVYLHVNVPDSSARFQDHSANPICTSGVFFSQFAYVLRSSGLNTVSSLCALLPHELGQSCLTWYDTATHNGSIRSTQTPSLGRWIHVRAY